MSEPGQALVGIGAHAAMCICVLCVSVRTWAWVPQLVGPCSPTQACALASFLSPTWHQPLLHKHLVLYREWNPMLCMFAALDVCTLPPFQLTGKGICVCTDPCAHSCLWHSLGSHLCHVQLTWVQTQVSHTNPQPHGTFQPPLAPSCLQPPGSENPKADRCPLSPTQREPVPVSRGMEERSLAPLNSC